MNIPNIGDIYHHFKGHIVEIVCVAKDSETLTEMVVYKHTETGEYWSRPLEMFNEELDPQKYPNASQKTRFVLLKSESSKKS